MELMPLDYRFKNVKRASKFLKSLANDNRLIILCTLAEGEMNVSEMEKVIGIRQPTLSQQLARLRADNLVSTRRDSKQIYYSLASNEAEQVIGLLYKLFCDDETNGANSIPDRADKIEAA